jgi:hypothetical protein
MSATFFVPIWLWLWRDAPSTFADPEVAMRKIREIAITPEAIQDGRIHIEKINNPLLFEQGGKPAEYDAGMRLAIERGLFWKHESGTFLKLTRGSDFFAYIE